MFSAASLVYGQIFPYFSHFPSHLRELWSKTQRASHILERGPHGTPDAGAWARPGHSTQGAMDVGQTVSSSPFT